MPKPLHHPDRDQIDLSAVLEALSEPIRREIVLRLLAEGEHSCSVFNDRAAKSNLSYHLARLREAGVTRTRVDGPYRMISVRTEDLAARFPGLLDAIVAAARSGDRATSLVEAEAAAASSQGVAPQDGRPAGRARRKTPGG